MKLFSTTIFLAAGALALSLSSASAQQTIKVGSVLSVTGPASFLGAPEDKTMRMYVDKINAAGGINGKKIELIIYDDGGDANKARTFATRLVDDDKVVAMIGGSTTGTSMAMIPVFEEAKIPFISFAGAVEVIDPVRKYVFNVRATYQHEAEKAVVHLHTQGITRIAVVHADDSFGADALEGAEKGFKQEGFQPVAVVKANRAKPDYSKIVPAIVGPDAQAVLWIGSGTAVIDGVKALRAAGSGAQVVTLSNNASKGFIKGLGPVGRGVIVTQVFPDEHSFAYGFIKDAIGLAKEKHLALSPAMLEGFAGARVLVEALRRAGPNPTRQKIETALEGMKKFDIGGMEVSYSPEHHTGVEFADLSIISGDGRFIR